MITTFCITTQLHYLNIQDSHIIMSYINQAYKHTSTLGHLSDSVVNIEKFNSYRLNDLSILVKNILEVFFSFSLLGYECVLGLNNQEN